MTLPALPFKIPEIPLPFDIPALMHPPITHFIIAIPIIVLLLEIVNLIVKKKALGVTTFFLLLLTVVASIAAYYTGSADGKAAWDILNSDGQAALKAHKLFGTYLMMASIIVLFFKLISAMVQKGLVKGIYILVLIFFVAGILKQGKEGGELVYKYGANVAPAKAYSDLMFTINDDMEDDDTIADLKEELAPEKEDNAAEKETTTEAPAVEEAKSEENNASSAEAEAPAAVTTDASTQAEENVSTETVEKSTEAAVTPEASPSEPAPEVDVVPAPAEAQPEIATH